MSIKPVLSHLESYQSFGIAIDAGVIYRSSDGLLTAGAALRNIGSQITAYHEDDNTHSLTPDLQAGISYKPQHAPFRFSLTMQDLTNWNHNKIVSKNSNGEFKTIKNGSFAKELVHHAIFGMEFIPIRNFYIATGYNIARRNELKGSIKTGSTGWTWGAGFRVYKFHVAYGSARYHLGGRTNFFTLSTNLSAF